MFCSWMFWMGIWSLPSMAIAFFQDSTRYMHCSPRLPQNRLGDPLSSRIHRSTMTMAKMEDSTTVTYSFPRDISDSVSKCRTSVQAALQARLSRMEIEMPVGAKFGIETNTKAAKKSSLNSKESDNDSNMGSNLPTLEQLQTSDRELARIFVEMFQPLGGNHIAVLFPTNDLADQAKEKWKGDSSAKCRILSMNHRKKSSNKNKSTITSKFAKAEKRGTPKKAIGFAQKLAAELEEEAEEENDENKGTSILRNPRLPEGIELAIFVAPGPTEYPAIETICQQTGPETLIILLNARRFSAPSITTSAIIPLEQCQFEPVFHLRAAPQDVAPGGLIHRAYPRGWLLARKPKIGPPKVLLTQSSCPTRMECQQVWENSPSVVGDWERGIETLVNEVTSWFR